MVRAVNQWQVLHRLALCAQDPYMHVYVCVCVCVCACANCVMCVCTAGRKEFVQYLPEATQGVIVQPVGSRGVLVVGTDTLRGLSRLDQVGVKE